MAESIRHCVRRKRPGVKGLGTHACGMREGLRIYVLEFRVWGFGFLV